MRLAYRSYVAVALVYDEFDNNVDDEEAEGMVVTGCAVTDMLVVEGLDVELVECLEDEDDECKDGIELEDDNVLAALLDAFSLDILSCSSSSGVMA